MEDDPEFASFRTNDGTFVDIFWSAEDGVYLASSHEYPSIMTHGRTKDEAFVEFCRLLADVKSELKGFQNSRRDTQDTFRVFDGCFHTQVVE